MESPVINKLIGKGKSRKRDVVEISDQDSDSDGEVKKPKQGANEILSALNTLREDVLKHNIPSGLKHHMLETFKCSICLKAPLTPPLIYGCCCQRIIGCDKCVENCYKEDHRCLICRTDNAFPLSSRIHGLDELLFEINKIQGAHPYHVPTPPSGNSDDDFM